MPSRQVRPLAPRAGSARIGQIDVMALHEDTQGLLWIGTLRNGLFRATTDTPHFAPSPPGAQASEFDVNTLLASRAEPGVVWLGLTQRGVARYDEHRGQVTRLFGVPDGLREPFSLHEDAVGVIWGGGVARRPLPHRPHARHRRGRAPRRRPRAAADPQIHLHASVRPRVLYIGTRYGGLFEFDGSCRRRPATLQATPSRARARLVHDRAAGRAGRAQPRHQRHGHRATDLATGRAARGAPPPTRPVPSRPAPSRSPPTTGARCGLGRTGRAWRGWIGAHGACLTPQRLRHARSWRARARRARQAVDDQQHRRAGCL